MGVYWGEVSEEGESEDAQGLTSVGKGRALKNSAEGKWLVKKMNGKDLRREKEQEMAVPRMFRNHPRPFCHFPHGPLPRQTGQKWTSRLRSWNSTVWMNPTRVSPKGRFFFKEYFPRGLQSPHLERGRETDDPHQLKGFCMTLGLLCGLVFFFCKIKIGKAPTSLSFWWDYFGWVNWQWREESPEVGDECVVLPTQMQCLVPTQS